VDQVFLLPDVGEGLIEADIVTWKVRVGDVVQLNQPLVDVETAKALVELPSPFAGEIVTLHAAEGETVAVDAPLVTIREGVAGAPVLVEESREAVLIGYGVANEEAPVTRTRRRREGLTTPVAALPSPATTAARSPRTTPPVRLLAKQRGVDITTLRGSGRDGLITRDDVLRASGAKRFVPTSSPDVASRFVGREIAPWRDGPLEERIPVKGVMKSMAESMVQSLRSAAHACVWLRVDATKSMQLVAALKNNPAYANVKVTPLAIVAMAFVDAAKNFPGVNSSFDDEAGEVVIRRRVNLGIAADTPRGLLVPNIKAADELDLLAMAEQLQTLVATARSGRVSPSDLAGTTLSITNVGPFGVDAAMPILPPDTSAILCIGQIQKAPWVEGESVVVRDVAEISMSFDHRHIDGATASAVLRHVGWFLNDPDVALARR
jgi:2-oxoisovalerate dehydrogenase E2 component (dihydrolipoyl transacylase)